MGNELIRLMAEAMAKIPKTGKMYSRCAPGLIESLPVVENPNPDDFIVTVEHRDAFGNVTGFTDIYAVR